MLRDKTVKERAQKLLDLGLRYDGQSFIYQDINFHWTDLQCMTDEEFNEALEGAKKRMETIKSEEES